MFTNSVRIAAATLAGRPGSVFLLGGRVRGVTQAIVGAEAHAMLAKLRVDVAFMADNGISVERVLHPGPRRGGDEGGDGARGAPRLRSRRLDEKFGSDERSASPSCRTSTASSP